MSISLLHEAPRLLLEERPELLLELLGVSPPEAAQLVLASADATRAVPMDRRADAVLLVRRDHAAVAAYVVEMQLAIVPDKLFSWPLYAAAIHARHRCPTTLVVLLAPEGEPRQRAVTAALRAIRRVDARHAASYLDLLNIIL